MSYIYCIENTFNKKKYIGKTICSFNIRKKNHINTLKAGKHANFHLQRAWDKYGENNFNFYILEECDKDKIDEREIYWIKSLDTQKNGYNITSGGGGTSGWIASEETREKHKQSMLNMSNETRQKLSEKAKGNKNGQNIVFTKERKEQIGNALRYKKKTGSSSLFHGVSFFKATGKWSAHITVNKKLIHLGFFKDEINAAEKYDEYVKKNNLPNPLNFK